MNDLKVTHTPSLIGRKVFMKYEFPLDKEVFEIVGETRNEVKIKGDFSAMNNYLQEQWDKKENIRGFI